MRFLLPLFLPFLLILYCSLQPGSSALLYEQVYANESIPVLSLPLSASDSASPEGEGNSNSAKSTIDELDKLSDEDLKNKKDQAETKLNDLKDQIAKSKSSLKEKQDDVKGRLKTEYDEKKEKWEQLDKIAKEMNKELKDAIDEYTIADRESRLANKTYSEYEKAITKLEDAKTWKTKVDGYVTRLPAARLEKTEWTNICGVLEIKGDIELNRELTAAKEAVGSAQKDVDDQQAIVNACSTNCKLKQDQLDADNLALTTANTALGKAQDAVDTLGQCPAKSASLEKEVEDLEKIERNPNAATEAQEAIEKAELESKDAKFDGIADKRDKASQALKDKESKKVAAETSAQSPTEVQEAKDAARQAKRAFDEAEREKKQVESEISELETTIPQLEKTRDNEQAQVDDLKAASERRSNVEKPGMGTVPIVGIVIGCLVLLAAVVGVSVYFKHINNKKEPKHGKGADAKDLEGAKANSSSGDNSAVQTPIQTPLPEPLPAIETPAAQSVVPVPVPVAAVPVPAPKAAPPTQKEKELVPFAHESAEGTAARLDTVPDDIPDQDMKEAMIIVKKDGIPDSIIHVYPHLSLCVYLPISVRGHNYGPGNMKRIQFGTKYISTCQDGRNIPTGYMDLDRNWRPPKFTNLPRNDFNPKKASKFLHQYDGDAATAVAIAYQDDREITEESKGMPMKRMLEQKRLREIANRNKREGKREGAGSEAEESTESQEHLVPGQEYDLIKNWHYEESRLEELRTYQQKVKEMRSPDYEPYIPHEYITEIKSIEEVECEKVEEEKEAAEPAESSLSDTQQTEVRIATSQSGSEEERSAAGSDVSKKSPKKKDKSKSKAKNSSRRSGKSDKEKSQRGSNSRKKSSGKKRPSEYSKRSEKDSKRPEGPPKEDSRPSQDMFELLNGKQIPYSEIKFQYLEGEEILMFDGGVLPNIDDLMNGPPLTQETCATELRKLLDHHKNNPGVRWSADMPFALKYALIRTYILKVKAQMKLLQLGEGQEPTILSGDTHGNAAATRGTLTQCGEPGSEEWKKQRFLFLGDYVDRGPCQEDNMIMLMLAKCAYPDHINLLRGNHEFYETNYCYGFFEELEELYTDETAINLHFYYNYAFSWMPIAAITTTTRIYHVHGGPPHWIPENGDLEKAFAEIPGFVWDSCHGKEKWRALVQACVWNDLAMFLMGVRFGPSRRGVGIDISIEQLDEFLERCNISLFARAHEMVLNGVEWTGPHCITVFSCFHYEGKENRSCIVRFSGFGTYTYIFFNPYKASEFNKLTEQQKRRFLAEEAAKFGLDHNLNNLTISLKGNLEALNNISYFRSQAKDKEMKDRREKKEKEKESVSMTLGRGE